MTIRWTIATSRAAPGAIAVVSLDADDPAELERAIRSCCQNAPVTGGVAVTDICAVDRGVVARWSETRADLMPHAGRAVLHAIAAHLESTFGPESAPSHTLYPEASSTLDARVLGTLARAASPRAIELLLDQPRRWASRDAGEDLADGAALARLLDPPLVVSIGPPNIGKSSLLNALAGRAVALAADEPGTTRDHVGVTVELDGLAVRYLDTPGRAPTDDPIDREAARLVQPLIERADLILSCHDATAPPADPPPGVPTISVATRADAHPPTRPAEVVTSAKDAGGLESLAREIRSRLVPDAALADPRPWRFWTGDDPRPDAP